MVGECVRQHAGGGCAQVEAGGGTATFWLLLPATTEGEAAAAATATVVSVPRGGRGDARGGSAGGVPRLIALLASSSVIVQKYAALGLWSLSVIGTIGASIAAADCGLAWLIAQLAVVRLQRGAGLRRGRAVELEPECGDSRRC